MAMSWSWQNGALLLLLALAVGLVLTSPDPAAPPLPAGGDHEQRLAYQACPECHTLAELPSSHRQAGGQLGGAYAKCYVCHD